MAWYYAAYVYSRRLVARIAEDLKPAMLSLGGTSRIQWFGTSAFRMTTDGPNAPFRKVSVTVTLRPREMPINWALGTAQGRRDAALVEASLRKDPDVHFELVDPQSRIGRRRSLAKSGWIQITLGNRSLLLWSEDEGKARRILEQLEPDALDRIMAIHVSTGHESGIAASVSVERGQAARGMAAIQALAGRLAD
jgi:hypothetical protein